MTPTPVVLVLMATLLTRYSWESDPCDLGGSRFSFNLSKIVRDSALKSFSDFWTCCWRDFAARRCTGCVCVCQTGENCYHSLPFLTPSHSPLHALTFPLLCPICISCSKSAVVLRTFSTVLRRVVWLREEVCRVMYLYNSYRTMIK